MRCIKAIIPGITNKNVQIRKKRDSLSIIINKSCLFSPSNMSNIDYQSNEVFEYSKEARRCEKSDETEVNDKENRGRRSPSPQKCIIQF